MSVNDAYCEWFNAAENHIKTWTILYNAYCPELSASICYHCQQSIEKYLKGYFINLSSEFPPRTHNLELLCKLFGEYDNEILQFMSECKKITEYSVKIRYPNEVDVDKSDVEYALNTT
jgi:HEPN domain-containing protein